MSEQITDFDTLLLGRKGPAAAKFKKFGDSIEGTLTHKESVHQAKFNADPSAPKELMYFKSGDKKMQPVLTLQTDLRDPEDDEDTGIRRVFVPFQMQATLQKASYDAGAKKVLPLGSRIKIVYTHDEPSKGGGSPRKEYTAVVTLPADGSAVTHSAPLTTNPALTPALIQLMRENGLAVPGE